MGRDSTPLTRDNLRNYLKNANISPASDSMSGDLEVPTLLRGVTIPHVFVVGWQAPSRSKERRARKKSKRRERDGSVHSLASRSSCNIVNAAVTVTDRLTLFVWRTVPSPAAAHQ